MSHIMRASANYSSNNDNNNTININSKRGTTTKRNKTNKNKKINEKRNLTEKDREKIRERKREERDYFWNEVLMIKKFGKSNAQKNGRCLEDDEDELFKKYRNIEEEEEEEENSDLLSSSSFSTYDDVVVKVDLVSLFVGETTKREYVDDEDGTGIDFNSGDVAEDTRTSNNDMIKHLREVSSFAADVLSLDEKVITNVEKRMMLKELTPIQRHAIPLAMMKKLDLVCSAHTGSGKTLAFAVPAVSMAIKCKTEKSLEEDNNNNTEDKTTTNDTICKTPCRPSVVILAPTRELARQIYMDVKRVCFDTGLRVACAHGGENCKPQLEHIAFGPEILVCTPGRLLDFCDDEYVDLREVKMLVLDEADRMLDLGFEPQLRDLLGKRGMIPPATNDDDGGRQTLLFSATFSQKVLTLASKYTRPSPYRARISVGRVGALARGVTQKLIEVQTHAREEKFTLLLEAIHNSNKMDEKTMVFCKQVKTAIWLKERLSTTTFEGDHSLDKNNNIINKSKISVETIHGELTQGARVRALEAFRDGNVSILVATDVASRGLDIASVEHVINFDLPTDKRDFEEYVHRLGRTARAGKKGTSTSFYVSGFEEEIGNGPIYKQLRNAFAESGDELPEWFLNHADAVNNNISSSSSIRKTSSSKPTGRNNNSNRSDLHDGRRRIKNDSSSTNSNSSSSSSRRRYDRGSAD